MPASTRRTDVGELSGEGLPAGPLYLHLDLDVVDPEELPGLRFPAAGGPGWPAVAEAARRVLATGQVVAVGVGCTWHPGHGAATRARPHLERVLAAWK
ncbi:MAG TPA: arginase family protein [Actinomycetota bacterium]|jgi:arginase|nr:arginase family protein [Actinomycetota bacterium]